MAVVDINSQRDLSARYLHQGRLWCVISGYEIRQDIMETVFSVLRGFFKKRSKLIAIRIELHLKQWTATNAPVSDFFQKLGRQLKKHYGKIYHRYIWVREQNQAKAQHYHVVLLVDGQFVKHPSVIKEIASRIWTYGYLCLAQNAFYRIHRNQVLRFYALVYRLSYLAKAETKGNRPSEVKDFGCNRA